MTGGFIEIHRGSNSQITHNFVEKEFFTKQQSYDGNSHPIASALPEAAQAIRDFLCVPVFVTSTYRTPAYNVLQGGVSGSAHTTYEAEDLAPQNWNKDKAQIILDDYYTKGDLFTTLWRLGIRGFGVYDWGLHLDVQDNPKRKNTFEGEKYAIWNNSSFSSSYTSSFPVVENFSEDGVKSVPSSYSFLFLIPLIFILKKIKSYVYI